MPSLRWRPTFLSLPGDVDKYIDEAECIHCFLKDLYEMKHGSLPEPSGNDLPNVSPREIFYWILWNGYAVIFSIDMGLLCKQKAHPIESTMREGVSNSPHRGV